MLNFLFGNIGGKIKLLGKIICFIGFASAILFFLAAVVFAVKLKVFWLVLVAIPATAILMVSAWVSSFSTIGYGQLIESTESIDKKLDDKAAEERD